MAEAQIYKIYKISSPQTDKVYIGSTKQTLNRRFSHHKYNLNCSSKSIIAFGDAEIELVEEIDEQNRLIRERHYIESYGEQCVNEIIPIRTKEETREYDREWSRAFYEANRDQILEHNREYYRSYYEANKEKYKEKITCECGSKITKVNISRHHKSMKHMKFVTDSTNQSSLDVE
jgi:hypothetical protein